MNHAIFDGQLEEPAGFIIKDSIPNDWGWCETAREYSKHSPIVITLSDALDERGFFLSILAHEMVHQWQQRNQGRMSHGQSFWAWQHRIEKLGLEFDKTY